MPLADRTTLNNLTPNLDIGDVADPALRLAYFQYMTDLSDANYNYVLSLVASGALSPYPPAQYNNLGNGNFDVWQRGTSFTNPASSAYLPDRWQLIQNADGGVLPATTIYSQSLLTSGDIANSFYALKINPNGAGSTFGVLADINLTQKNEFGTRYLCGLLKEVTISFYAKSDIPGKRIGVKATQNYGTGGSPSTAETLNGASWTLTSTWTKYTYTFTTNTLVGKTFGSNNDDWLAARLCYVWGTTKATEVGATTAETFGGSGNIYIAQVQLCAGDAALPFQPRTFAGELQLCQRYYEKSFNYDQAPANNIGAASQIALSNNRADQFGLSFFIPFAVKKRVIAPTITTYNPSAANSKIRNASTGLDVDPSVSGVGDRRFEIIPANATNCTANASYSVHWTADAEI